MNSTVTTTISLPRTLAERARRLSRHEDRTVSELFREAFRVYERERISSWGDIRASLLGVGAVGKKTNLSKFVTRDRRNH